MNRLYEDIIHLSRPLSPHHPPMSRYDRAAQFSPFAALTGYDDAVRETARLTDSQILLTEEQRIMLDRKQAYLLSLAQKQPEITVVYFEPDTKKCGGNYQRITGKLLKVDLISRTLILSGGMTVDMEQIIQLDSPALPDSL